ncbi:DUF1902 domain-containing protein [Breznakiellaceae bacterium SP9]
MKEFTIDVSKGVTEDNQIVWLGKSSDIFGLHLEHQSLEVVITDACELAPYLLETNHQFTDAFRLNFNIVDIATAPMVRVKING